MFFFPQNQTVLAFLYNSVFCTEHSHGNAYLLNWFLECKYRGIFVLTLFISWTQQGAVGQ